jgi:hypothetical protein
MLSPSSVILMNMNTGSSKRTNMMQRALNSRTILMQRTLNSSTILMQRALNSRTILMQRTLNFDKQTQSKKSLRSLQMTLGYKQIKLLPCPFSTVLLITAYTGSVLEILKKLQLLNNSHLLSLWWV